MMYPEVRALKEGAFLVSCGVAGLLVRVCFMKGKGFMRLLKRESKTLGEGSETLSMHPAADAATAPTSSDMQSANAPVSSWKDTFISQEVRLKGALEGQGNVVIEGRVEGNVRSSHQVRVESSGVVVGDIYAQHVVINGRVEGRCYGDAVTLQSSGHIQGDIFTDGLVIEKGGVFIGQSQSKVEEEVVPRAGAPAVLTVLSPRSEVLSKE